MATRFPLRLTAALSLVPALALAEPPQAAPAASTDTPATEAAGDGLAFAASLEACVVASHQSPHPFVSGFVVEHAVSGIEGEHCGYSQTMPGGMRMECRLSQAGRNGLAAEFREVAAGRLAGGTAEQAAWTRECDIITADGKRMPLGKD
ncbi:hypothetical protein [Arenimonas donghaensis]|uniref:DUF3617 family protein n=1 Tax=Arenimonas donghaensis DSM 18148 = HO3-R19 TaxID=1121014 RepID=A0A087MLK7_9GAMM|nr:hypothetical protein [Arenimonas donghaensis]KFL37760.1 hypothetical protein N788_00900 [Arenimonas donghaensis DSM 18148 = HO3-R19]